MPLEDMAWTVVRDTLGWLGYMHTVQGNNTTRLRGGTFRLLDTWFDDNISPFAAPTLADEYTVHV